MRHLRCLNKTIIAKGQLRILQEIYKPERKLSFFLYVSFSFPSTEIMWFQFILFSTVVLTNLQNKHLHTSLSCAVVRQSVLISQCEHINYLNYDSELLVSYRH